MKRKIALIAAAMLFSTTFISACGRTPSGEVQPHEHNFVNGYCTVCGEKDENQNPEIPGGNQEFSYYEETALRADKKLFVLNASASLSNDSLNTASALQGLFARKEVTFYIDGKYMTNGTNADMYYLEEAKEKYGVTSEDIELKDAVQMYVENWQSMVESGVWGSAISLTEGFKDASGYYSAYTEKEDDQAKAGYNTPGYIVYNPANYSVNIASTLAGITGFLPVSSEEAEIYRGYGLVEKMNVTSDMWSYKWCFDAVMGELSTKGLVHQRYDLNGKTNYYIRDWGVANKCMHVYYDSTISINNSLRKRIHQFLDKNIPIMGYAYSEDADVALFSQYGQFLVPTDYTMNLTVHLADAFRQKDGFTQPNDDTTQKAEQGKHYVAFVVSDGDNAQYWQNTSIFSTNYMNALGRENDDFAVTWSITPSLSDMMPLVMDAAYNGDIATENDYFCAPVSGQGYINAGQFYNAGEAYMNTFLGNLDTYLTRSGLGVTTIIGAESYEGGIFKTLDAYAGVPALKGGLVLNGYKYFGGAYSGGVYWKNGKPFIVPRDSLWQTTPAYIAARINMYAQSAKGHDITDINAYSVINVHPWSHSYKDIRAIVNMLSDNVEVVSLDAVVKMMSDNVTNRADSENKFSMPDQSGNTITEDDLKENPSSIPTDPLYHDFLLWEETWTGDVSHGSSDASSSNVGAVFATNLKIGGNGTAKKPDFELPIEDHLWVSFYARADSTNANEQTAFKLKMTVDGTEKTVIARAGLRGVSGTETKTVTGDGWQAFAFPIKQYFPDYKGKTASFEVENLTAVGMKLDLFSISAKTIVPTDTTVCEDPYNNEFEGSTEDWMLGHQFTTSQYYHWSCIDREKGIPIGSLQIDCSDGGGDEKRNANTNVWSAKNVTIDREIEKLSVNITGKAKVKISMYVDGKYVVLLDWTSSQYVGEMEIDLKTLCVEQDIASLNGKEVTFIYEARDNATNDDGAGQDCNMYYFRLS
jgi:hypothetical protein